MKLLSIAFAALTVFFTVTFVLPMQRVQAEDVIQMNNNQDIIMSGTVSDLDSKGFMLNSGTQQTQVSITDIGATGNAAGLLKNGMKVSVRGTLGTGNFREPIIRATNMSAFQESAPPAVQTPAGVTANGQPGGTTAAATNPVSTAAPSTAPAAQ